MSVGRVKLRQFEFFVCAADRGSFSAAAEELHVSQPALGQAIQDLEAEFGQPLFVRRARGVALTEAGEILLGHARGVLDAVDRTTLAMAAMRRQPPRELRLGYPPTPGRLIVPELLVQLDAQHEVRTSSHSSLSHDLLDQLAEDKVDVALCYDTLTTHHIDAVPLLDEALFLMGPPSIVNGQDGDIDFEELSAFPLVLDSRYQGTRRLLEETAAKLRVRLTVSFDVEAIDLRHELMRRHGRCTIVPLGAFHDAVQAGDLAARRIVRPTVSRTLYLVFREGFDPALRATLLKLTRNIVADRVREARYFWREVATV